MTLFHRESGLLRHKDPEKVKFPLCQVGTVTRLGNSAMPEEVTVTYNFKNHFIFPFSTQVRGCIWCAIYRVHTELCHSVHGSPQLMDGEVCIQTTARLQVSPRLQKAEPLQLSAFWTVSPTLTKLECRSGVISDRRFTFWEAGGQCWHSSSPLNGAQFHKQEQTQCLTSS